jgi:ribosomal-protein-alanine N-acetyltransferase
MLLPPRHTARLVLRELAPDDAPALHAFESDPDVTRYMSYEPRTFAEVVRYVDDCRADARVEPRRVWELAVALSDDDHRRVVGRTGCRVDDSGQEARIWYAFHPGYWNRGYASEAVLSLLGLLFDDLGVHRVVADIDPRNGGSAKLAERLGLRREAHFVEDVWIRGAWCDTWIYAMLRREWQARSGQRRR